jgi:Protein of unknown function (DUF4236)
MAFRFQRRISILPGVRLNFSRSGVSTTIGVRGASVTLGGRTGPTANLGIPGTGLSIRTPLRPRAPRSGDRTTPPSYEAPSPSVPAPTPAPPTSEMVAVESEAADALTTHGLSSFKDLVIQGQRERDAAEQIVQKTKTYREASEQALTTAQHEKSSASERLAKLESSWFRRFRGTQIAATRTEVEKTKHRCADAARHLTRANELAEIAEQRRAELYLELDLNLSGPAHAAWKRLEEAFEELSKSKNVWDITASRYKRAGSERSIATAVIDRKPTGLSISELPIIQTQYRPLRWHNVNGPDLFLFPGFVIVFQTIEHFGVLDLLEVQLEFTLTKFQESDKCPADAQQVGVTWAYANRDGTPDRRYSSNPQIPIVLYGELSWLSKTGLSETFLISNAKAAAIFADALTELRNAISNS